MPTAMLGEEMPGSMALRTDLHTLVRTTTEPNTLSVDDARLYTRQQAQASP